ncbi:TonB-dependent siderophore receptor [Altererythrobacter aquiaggeris]|uniref:TonB-dependent receptor n=1 Tax=Aestuarierythrobacter aquiaggeris TaxID=1898396 RepID=UPI0030168BE9
MLSNKLHRSALLVSASLLYAVPALAADAAPVVGEGDRDYLGESIVVVGRIDGYTIEDGSSGTKTPTPLIDVPQSISVITQDQLHDQGVTQLNDALRYVPGISLETGEGHRDEVFIRGQETTADFYLDGLRDDAQYYRSLYNIERIEILKGPNALIFGRGGGGGAINRVSKIAKIGDTIADLSASVDTFGAFDLAADLNAPIGTNVAARVNAAYEEFDNHRDFYSGRFFGISPTLAFDLSPDTRLIATYSYDDDSRVTDRGVPSLDGRPLEGFDETFFGDQDFNTASAKVHIARARIEHRFNDAVSINLTGQYADYDKVYANILPRGTDGTTVELSGYRDFTRRENTIGQANLVWSETSGNVRHTFMAGIEASSQETFNGRSNAVFGGTSTRVTAALDDVIFVPPISLSAPVRDTRSRLSTTSVYFQEQLEFGDKLELIGGVRYDRFDLETRNFINNADAARDDGIWSPRFGAVFKPSVNFSIYGSFATSFLPQSGDQFLVLSNTARDLAPEKFETLEAGVKWAIKPDLLFTASVFQLDRSNTTASDPNNTGLTLLTGASRTKGAELQLAGRVTEALQVNLGYAYMDGSITSDTDFAAAGSRLQQLPEHQITAWGRYAITDKLGVGAGVVYQSEQFTSFSNAVTLPSYVRADLAAYYEISDRIAVQLNVENVFDTDYYPSAHGDDNIQPAAPLSASVGFRMSL